MWRGKLLGCGSDAKTVKGNGEEYLTAILYMKPWKQLGKNLCPMAEIAGCHEACLNTAGRGQMGKVQNARERKSTWYIKDRKGFLSALADDIRRFSNYCSKKNVQPVVRLNGTSDIQYENHRIWSDGEGNMRNIFEVFENVIFYDYTKIAKRKSLKNYHLTWSYSEADPKYTDMMPKATKNGMNTAVVFRDKNYPKFFKGLPVVSGDDNDLRFTDPEEHIIALYAKGRAKYDTTGFVMNT